MESSSAGGPVDDDVAVLKQDLQKAKKELENAKGNDVKAIAAMNMITSINNRITSIHNESQKLDLKVYREELYKRLSSSATCRAYCDALALKIKSFYIFDQRFESGPTIGDVLKAVRNGKWKHVRQQQDDEIVGPDGWATPVKKGRALLKDPLPDLFTPAEWARLAQFNEDVNEAIHSAILPKTKSGRTFIILPHDQFNDDMIAFLRSIGVKSRLFKKPEDLEVKDEAVLSEGSSEIN